MSVFIAVILDVINVATQVKKVATQMLAFHKPFSCEKSNVVNK
ncbi:hypothetical protein CG08_1375 [Riemerella anatipestifer]|uniref:Uncharacterized protein n=1 Tax=Riemerella anatipestifer (strain ATCC 11845 / DSM 15868 / JCM 9532 / NCTC 11014) TaxID=693978 RepID=H8MBT1_RIEAD|nr:hypothetical protein RIA_0988 [Riemerella anatipestifer RA-GD]AFD56396.1 hypothetical protein RA0C_1503 [Riemerella anatipestifer ATCC 11845 = DSM 15868]AGC39674.1 hypothetical protein G148_0369 [Riemerella anatipestifer RA-CH-2]AKP69593.1 hypothetical protein CG08_1375 [Riemerella anatipestifer]AKP71501.1 hypothetical protein CG09_1315 [Riemerella anatipestifer]